MLSKDNYNVLSFARGGARNSALQVWMERLLDLMAARNRIISLNKSSLYKNYLLIMRFSMYLKQELFILSRLSKFALTWFVPKFLFTEKIYIYLKMSQRIWTRMLKTSGPGLYWDFERSYFLDLFFLFQWIFFSFQEILTSVIILLQRQIILLVIRTFS